MFYNSSVHISLDAYSKFGCFEWQVIYFILITILLDSNAGRMATIEQGTGSSTIASEKPVGDITDVMSMAVILHTNILLY